MRAGGGAIGTRDAGLVPIDVERQFRVERRELAACADAVGELHQVGADLRAFDVLRVRKDFFQRAVLLQERARLLGADQRHAGDVVDAVADERLIVDDLIGANGPVGE